MDISKTPVDIKTLIQNSTIDIYNKTKLVDKLQRHFNDEEQRLYVCNLFLYLNYNPLDDFIINLENVWKFIGFSNKGNAKRLLQQNFIEDKDYKTLLLSKEKQIKENDKDNRGGYNKETVMLNINTFKKLCLRANTSNADKIHDYYIRLEMIYNELMKEQIDEEKKKYLEQTQNIISNKKIEKHELLVEKFRYKKCVYVAELDTTLIKIGSSKNIEERARALKVEYGKCIFLDIFECDNFRDVEEYILKNDSIVKNLYKNPIRNNKNPREVVQLSNDFTYLHVIEIIKEHLKQIVFLSPYQQLESKRIDFLTYLIKEKNYSLSDIEKLSQMSFNSIQNQNITTNEQSTNKQNTNVISYKTNPVVQKLIKARSVDKIDPETLSIIETYESIGVIINNHKEENYEYNQLYRSIIKNNIYKNYRWNYHATIIRPTVKITKMANPIESIVKLDVDKNFIQIFKTKKDVQKLLCISHKRITNIIDNRILFNGFYYIKNSECKEYKELTMFKNNEKYKIPNAKKIKQINILTKEEYIYESMNEVYKIHGLCRQTIKKYINAKKEYCGFLWEYVI
jgi:hypothetical protein